jgi:hypothetical protein
VAFWFEFLTRERLAGEDDVLLVPGSISYLLANSGALALDMNGQPTLTLLRSISLRSNGWRQWCVEV